MIRPSPRATCPPVESIMTLPAFALPVETAAGVSRRGAVPDRKDLARPARCARRGAGARDRAALSDCRRCWRGCWPGRDVEIDAVEDFLDPTIRKLMPDPYTVTQMETAAKRIADAAVRGEKVAIFGDYDVDGATSAALLAWHLRHCGLDPLIHIPDRLFEGYGPNTDAVRALAGEGRDAAGHRRLRHHQPRAAGGSAAARHVRRRDRPSPVRRAICPRSTRWSIRTGPTISPASAISPRSGSCWSRWSR